MVMMVVMLMMVMKMMMMKMMVMMMIKMMMMVMVMKMMKMMVMVMKMIRDKWWFIFHRYLLLCQRWGKVVRGNQFDLIHKRELETPLCILLNSSLTNFAVHWK